MSLKAFHVVFIVASIALAFGFGAWSLLNYRAPSGTVWDLVTGLAAFAVGVGLVVYERYFLKKLKDVSYL
jgi:hypothetical protein